MTRRGTGSGRARRAILKLVTGLGLIPATTLIALPALAQGFPAHTVRIIVPFPAGGTTDILARQLASGLMAKWDVPVIVDNKAGASGTIGSEMLVQSPPDGYTLMLTATHHVINPGLYPQLKYDTRSDFTPVALIATVPNVLLVNPALPVRTVQELVRYARDNPGKLSFGSTGIGGANHLAGEMFKLSTGIDVLHIPYKGAAPALNDLLGGQIPMMFDSLPGVIEQVRAGKLRALGVTSLKRAPAAPDIPTLDEAGIKGFEALAWFGLYAPGKMSPPLARRLNVDVVDLLKSEKMRTLFASQGADPGLMTQPEFARFVDAEIDKWGKVIVAAKVKID